MKRLWISAALLLVLLAVSLANAGFQDKIFIRGDLQPIFHQREADGTIIYKSGAFAVLCEP